MSGPDAPSHDALAARLIAHFAAEDAAASPEAPCSSPEALERWFSGERTPEVRARVEAHVAACAECRESWDALGTLEAEGALALEPLDLDAFAPAPAPVPLELARRAGERAPRRPRWVPLALAAGALLVGGVVAALALGDGSAPLRDKGGADGDAGDRVQVVVDHDGLARRLLPGQRLAEGDRFGVFYTATRAGYLTVIGRDATGAGVAVHPADAATSAAAAPGVEVALPHRVRVGAREGCEWLVAVFSDAPLAVDDVRAAVVGATAGGEATAGCPLEVDVPGARTVSVVPLLP